jgi:SAM-dependent methyltransferase
VRLDDAELVRREYASEEKLAVRRRAWSEWLEGPDAGAVAFQAVAEQLPERVLEVGCGEGEFAERLGSKLRGEVVALDLSPRMVELTRARGVDARVGDVQSLPFDDGSFDVAVANWMLYHVPDLERGLAELARVLRPDGRLVATTTSDENLGDLWERLGDASRKNHPFTRENGTETLARHFAQVELRPVDATLVFPDRDAVVQYVRASITRRYLADRVPELEGPVRARAAQGVFVAQKAA